MKSDDRIADQHRQQRNDDGEGAALELRAAEQRNRADRREVPWMRHDSADDSNDNKSESEPEAWREIRAHVVLLSAKRCSARREAHAGWAMDSRRLPDIACSSGSRSSRRARMREHSSEM